MLRAVDRAQMAHVRTAVYLFRETTADQSLPVAVRTDLHLAKYHLFKQLSEDFRVAHRERNLLWLSDSQPISPKAVELLNNLSAKLARVHQAEIQILRTAARL